jgi:hypothetical protein
MKITLLEKQHMFSKTLARFILDLASRGYYVTLGEAWRPNSQAQLYAISGKGIVNSNHCIRLAVDLNIFLDGVWLVTRDELEIPGKLWKSYSNDLVECCWGGDFKSADCCHFSFEHNGIK